MDYETFLDSYKPQKNTVNANAPFDGLMYETYGAELDAVMRNDVKHIWTLVDSEGTYILPGIHFVNRLGYFVTEKPWESEDLEIEIDSDED